jgi:hypothetical protein
MEKYLKSVIISLSIVLLYFYATEGMVRLFDNDVSKRNGRISIAMTLLFIISFVLIIVSYHVMGPHDVNGLYMSIIIFHLSYLTLGSSVNFLIKH